MIINSTDMFAHICVLITQIYTIHIFIISGSRTALGISVHFMWFYIEWFAGLLRKENLHITKLLFYLKYHLTLLYLSFIESWLWENKPELLEKLNIFEKGFFVSKMKRRYLWIGLLCVSIGWGIRIAAFCSLGRNFSYKLAEKKNKTHKLCTSGIYTYLRHPSYTGVYLRELGMQLLLGNVFSFFVLVLYWFIFFSLRITEEEEKLVRIFGEEYREYRKRTFVFIPYMTLNT